MASRKAGNLSGYGKTGKLPFCVGSAAFDPEVYLQDIARQEKVDELLRADDFAGAIKLAFHLPDSDSYVYHAMTEVRLAEVQRVVSLGGVNGLHAWYRSSEDGSPLPPPPRQDSDAYVSIFQPSTLTTSALKAFAANAKKASLRAEVAAYLLAKRFVYPAVASVLTIPKAKKPPSPNPYFTFWAWSARSLEWCGPCDASAQVATSHHVLPILMHHFGCVTPSHEALAMLKLVAEGRPVVDMGSGNGYWTFMLRQYGLVVHAVDSGQSAWRVNWVVDTVVSDGVKWLKRNSGGKDMVLLLVYPVVGGGVAGGKEGDFTRSLLDAFAGDTIAVVGTQNRNGYTGFKDVTMEEFMEREHREWTRVAQVPIPSFAGKDEALFVFQRGERAPKTESGEAAR